MIRLNSLLLTMLSSVALILFLTAGQSVVAQDNNDEVARAALLKIKVYQQLADAKTEEQGRAAEKAMWAYWFDQAPTSEARAALDAGIERREAYDFEAAENHLNELVEAAPDYAEGYNQRAFIRFLRENYSGSRDDLEKTLELEPQHFGALSGLYHILRIENRQKAALGVLFKAVTIHPWLKERHGLPEEQWPPRFRDLHEKGVKI